MGEENDNDRTTAELQARVAKLEAGLASACARIEKLERLETSAPKRKKPADLVWEEDGKNDGLRASTGDGKEYVISHTRIKIDLGDETYHVDKAFFQIYYGDADLPLTDHRRVGSVPTEGEAKALAAKHYATARPRRR